MEFRASHRGAGITPRKTRYVIDLIRGQDVNRAFEILAFTQKRATGFIDKVLRSAVANASQSTGVNVNKLYVREARVDCGPVIPARFQPGPMGRALPVRRRLSHIHVVLAERDAVAGKAQAEAPEKADKKENKEKKEKAKAPAAEAKAKGKKGKK